MDGSLIQTEEVTPSIYTVALNRPEKRNALSIPLLEAFCQQLEQLDNDPSVRVVIIKGNGPVFCSGLDLAEAGDPNKSIQSAELIAKAFSTLHQSRLITIAAAHGAALAGGAGLLCACDLAIAAENTLFGFPETRKGLAAAQVLTFLVRQVKPRDIRELLLVGETIAAEKALSIGLINRISEENTLLADAVSMAKSIVQGAPRATSLTKELIEELSPGNFDRDLQMALSYHEKVRTSDEAKEGIAAFLEKRPPVWLGVNEGSRR